MSCNMSYDELHTAYHDLTHELELVTQALESCLKTTVDELPTPETFMKDVSYGTSVLLSSKVKVNDNSYSIIQSNEFMFYIKNDIMEHVDIENDSLMILTQMSDYVFETIYTNGGVTQEQFLVKNNLVTKE